MHVPCTFLCLVIGVWGLRDIGLDGMLFKNGTKEEGTHLAMGAATAAMPSITRYAFRRNKPRGI